MRDLDKDELGSVYGAGGWRRWCPPPRKSRKIKSGGRGGSSSGRGGKGKGKGKGGSSS